MKAFCFLHWCLKTGLLIKEMKNKMLNFLQNEHAASCTLNSKHWLLTCVCVQILQFAFGWNLVFRRMLSGCRFVIWFKDAIIKHLSRRPIDCQRQLQSEKILGRSLINQGCQMVMDNECLSFEKVKRLIVDGNSFRLTFCPGPGLKATQQQHETLAPFC